jgi:hypothetical protein
MNQLNNILELQKSKQERLQSHIQSLEKHISDMVNDYESKLMSVFMVTSMICDENCIFRDKLKEDRYILMINKHEVN